MPSNASVASLLSPLFAVIVAAIVPPCTSRVVTIVTVDCKSGGDGGHVAVCVLVLGIDSSNDRVVTCVHADGQAVGAGIIIVGSGGSHIAMCVQLSHASSFRTVIPTGQTWKLYSDGGITSYYTNTVYSTPFLDF